jgi:hypothetical protein
MTITWKLAMFHQSIRHFGSPKSAINRNVNGERPNRWRMQPRPIGTTPGGTTRHHALQENSSIDNLAMRGTEAREPDGKANGKLQINPELGHAVLRIANPIDHSSHPMAFSDKASKAISSTLLQPSPRGVGARRSDPMQHIGPITATDIKPHTKNPTGTPLRPDLMSRFGPNIHHASSDTRDYTLNTTEALPKPASAGPNNIGLSDKIVSHSGSSPKRASDAFYDDGIGRNEVTVRKATPTLGARLPEPMASTRATLNKHSPTVSNAIGMAPLRRGTGGAFPKSNEPALGESGSASPHDNTISADQSSNTVGELWLDTLSLRDWLQAYLTNEMGRASHAANRFGTSLN